MDPVPPPPETPALGAILAGGASRRFGAPKALAEVGGARIVARVHAALAAAVPRVVVIAGDPLLAAALPLPSRPDALPGGGPLGGVHAALLWAREEGARGALCAACDMPFLSPGLLRLLLRRAGEGAAPAVAPEGGRSRFGVEPLCAWYGVEALPEVERRLRAGERALGPLLAALGAERVPLAEVRRHGEPERIFLNVNTPEDLRRAERLAAGGEEPDEPHP